MGYKKIKINGENYINEDGIVSYYEKILRENFQGKQYKHCKDILVKYLRENEDKIIYKAKQLRIKSKDLREYFFLNNIDEMKILKALHKSGTLITNTQGKFKHSTFIKGERVSLFIFNNE